MTTGKNKVQVIPFAISLDAGQLPSFGMELSINGKYADYIIGAERLSVFIDNDGQLCVTVECLERFDKFGREVKHIAFGLLLAGNEESAYAWARQKLEQFYAESLERQDKQTPKKWWQFATA